MGTRVYYRDSHGMFHGSAGASGSSVGRAGGFAVTGRHGASQPTRPTGNRASRALGAVRTAQRAQLRRVGQGVSRVAKDRAVQRIVVRSAIIGGIGLASSTAGKRMRAGNTKYAPTIKAIGATVRVVRALDKAEAPVRVFAMGQPKALGMGPKGRATVRARKRRGSRLYSGA